MIQKRIPIIVLTFILLLSGFGYYLNMVLIPEYKENQAVLQEKQLFLDAKRAELERVQTLDRIFDKIEIEANRAVAALPSEKEIPSIIYQITNIADEHALSTNNVTIIPNLNQTVSNQVSSVGINLAFTGSYNDIVKYMRSLESSLRLTNIRTISISGSNALDDTTSPLSISLEGETYYSPVKP